MTWNAFENNPDKQAFKVGLPVGILCKRQPSQTDPVFSLVAYPQVKYVPLSQVLLSQLVIQLMKA